jgi:hypothetical protein
VTVSPNLKGLLNRSGIVTYAPGGAEARYISIRHGIRLMEDVEAVPEIIVLNPADAELFDLSNATTAGMHANPGPAGRPPRLRPRRRGACSRSAPPRSRRARRCSSTRWRSRSSTVSRSRRT